MFNFSYDVYLTNPFTQAVAEFLWYRPMSWGRDGK